MINYTKNRFTKEEEIELQNVLEDESSLFERPERVINPKRNYTGRSK